MDPASPPRSRLQAIDALRGAIMILMALDHVRDFLHSAAISFPPEDLARTNPTLFFTRWVTHFCAPVFMFTAGMGAFFWRQRGGRTNLQLSRFLVTRGLWLVLLELTVMRLAYNFNLSGEFPIFLLVLWVLGLAMIVLAGLIHLPIKWLAGLSLAVIALHNCLDGVRAARFGSAAGVWNILHQSGMFSFGGRVFLVGYPLVPWFAVMAAGFCFGAVFLLDPASRRKISLATGCALTLAFVVIRAVNTYGNPVPWSHRQSGVFTILSFLNCTKYPPSLDFLLMTLGPALIALALLDRRRFGDANPLIVFGRVPLFYFVVHFYVIHALAAVLALIRYGGPALAFIFNPLPTMGGPRKLFPADFGYSLWVVYLAWALLVVSLYPLCRWFAGVKARRRDWWLSYL